MPRLEPVTMAVRFCDIVLFRVRYSWLEGRLVSR